MAQTPPSYYPSVEPSWVVLQAESALNQLAAQDKKPGFFTKYRAISHNSVAETRFLI